MNEQWQELKETITEMRDNDGTGTQQEACKFLANLMDVLEKQMSGSEIPNSSDCISRQAAIDALYHVDEYNGRSIEAIRDLPPVTPQPKTGHWIEGKYRDDDIRYNDSSYKCDKCGRIVDFKENYCPNCGAKMVESQESEDK